MVASGRAPPQRGLMMIHDAQSRRVSTTFWKQSRTLQIKCIKRRSEKKGVRGDQGTSERIKTMARVVFVNDKSRDWCTAKSSSLEAVKTVFTHRTVTAFFIAESTVGGKRGKPAELIRGCFRILFTTTATYTAPNALCPCLFSSHPLSLTQQPSTHYHGTQPSGDASKKRNARSPFSKDRRLQ